VNAGAASDDATRAAGGRWLRRAAVLLAVLAAGCGDLIAPQPDRSWQRTFTGARAGTAFAVHVVHWRGLVGARVTVRNTGEEPVETVWGACTVELLLHGDPQLLDRPHRLMEDPVIGCPDYARWKRLDPGDTLSAHELDEVHTTAQVEAGTYYLVVTLDLMIMPVGAPPTSGESYRFPMGRVEIR
jgi:hypothetical protein